jgi:hypothetical protein
LIEPMSSKHEGGPSFSVTRRRRQV